MSTTAFLAQLRDRDIRIWMEGDKLRCNAPAGALTDELREELRRRREDIASFLSVATRVAAQQSAIVPLQARGAQAPIFGVPGHTGDVFCYRALSQALGQDQPFFGLQPPGLDGSEPLRRVEDLAALYAAQIRTHRPAGPWIIAGYCAGGTVAFELAQQLVGSGEAAGFLVLFGAPYPTNFRPLRRLRHRLEYRAQGWRARARLLAAQSNRERLAYLAWRLRRVAEPPDELLVLRARLQAATVSALRAYEPRPFRGRVHHFAPCAAWARRLRAEEWRSVAPLLETHFGPHGCTGDDMLHEQYVSIFAEQLAQVVRARAC